jgi:hypothetical protein
VFRTDNMGSTTSFLLLSVLCPHPQDQACRRPLLPPALPLPPTSSASSSTPPTSVDEEEGEGALGRRRGGRRSSSTRPVPPSPLSPAPPPVQRHRRPFLQRRRTSFHCRPAPPPIFDRLLENDVLRSSFGNPDTTDFKNRSPISVSTVGDTLMARGIARPWELLAPPVIQQRSKIHAHIFERRHVGPQLLRVNSTPSRLPYLALPIASPAAPPPAAHAPLSSPPASLPLTTVASARPALYAAFL